MFIFLKLIQLKENNLITRKILLILNLFFDYL